MVKNENNRINKRRSLIIAISCISGMILLFVLTMVIILCSNKFTLELSLAGDSEITVEYGDRYSEQGADASFYGSLLMRKPRNAEVEVCGEVKEDILGSYTVEYTAVYTFDYIIGERTYTASTERIVNVIDSSAPVIELISNPDTFTLPGQPYEEEGYTALDNYDKDITSRVNRYEEEGRVYYSVSDSSGNKTEIVRDIFYDDPYPPELLLLGDSEITLTEDDSYIDPGYTATDNVDGDITDSVTVSGEVITERPGIYTLTYTVSDGYDNTVSTERTVTVKSKKSPTDPDNIPALAPDEPNGKIIYLTFDDGPSKHTETLLDVLDKYDVKATFFVVNTGYLDLLPRMAEAGHTIAMHTATHNYDEIYASEEAYFEDLYSIQALIKEQIGYSPTIFRFPGGSSNMISRFNPGIMTRLTEATKAQGYRYFDWNVDSNDAGGTRTSDGVFENVTKGVATHNNSIVLQHDTNGYSVEAVERIIEWGLENGYTFMPLTEYAPVCEHSVQN